VDVWFEDTGPCDGPVLFFVYGLGCAICHWKYQMQFVARGGLGGPARIVWMDFRGHGASPDVPKGERVRMSDVVQDLATLAQLLEINQAIFLGQSMGGTLALQLASIRPDLVAGLFLQGAPIHAPSRSFGPFSVLTRRLWHGAITVNRIFPDKLKALRGMGQGIHLPLREAVRIFGFNPELAQTDDIDEYVAELFKMNPSVFFDLAADLEGFELEALHPPKVPGLILAGERDTLVPLADARELARWYSAAELVMVPHGSHCPHLDDPSLVNRILATFVTRHWRA
jgi:3-oxoadipate enol-lactonase